MKMKRILCVVVVFCIVCTLSGCFNRIPDDIWSNPNLEGIYSFVDVMTGDTDLEDWHDNNVITRVKWQNLKLSEKHSAMYPSLSEAFDKYNAERLTEAKALMYEFIPFAEEMRGEEYNPVFCQAESEFYLQRADKYIVSLLEGIEQYTGGIHPDYAWHGRNYDPDTGEMVKITDVLKDTKELPSILEKKITEKYPDVTFFDLKDTFGKYNLDEFSWTIDYQGITFWFSPYEIASYAVGTLSAKIWFDEYADMFNKEYTKVPENYVISLPMGLNMEFDLIAGDNVKDTVWAERYLDDYGSYNMFSLTLNSNTYTDEINYGYEFDAYLAHLGDKNYVYYDLTSDNDYHMICVLDINGEKIRQVKEMHGTGFYGEFIEEGYETRTVYKVAVNDPSSFTLETRFDILGTRGATAEYMVSEKDGTPEMIVDAYTFSYGHNIKTSRPLEAELLPGMEKTTIPEGTLLLAYQTDGKSYVDMKTENGGVVRLSIDISDWPRMVNGMPEDECFEELFYAG